MDPAGRIDRAERLIRAGASRLFSCWMDPALLVHWLPPRGMAARVTQFEPFPGGSFRLVLTYEDPDQGGNSGGTADAGTSGGAAFAGTSGGTGYAGKSGGGEDIVAGRFVLVAPPHHLAFTCRFDSSDPAFAGEMRMDWDFLPENGATRLRISASNVPPGISASDHILAMRQSLSQLAALVE